MLVDTLVRSIADELNDLEPGFEYVGWPVERLHDYIRQALWQVAALRPELFTSSQTVTLTPGPYQTLPAGFVKLLDITSNVNADGTPGTPVYPSSFTLTRSLAGRSCLLAPGGGIGSWAFDPNSQTSFYVNPPVPVAPPTRVRFLGQVPPPAVVAGGTIAVPGGSIDDYYNPILDWALYRAFMKDTESDTSFRRAEQHYRAHYQFFGVKANMDAFGKAQRERTDTKVGTNA